MAFGFFLAIAALVFEALYLLYRAVASDLKRGLGPYPSASPPSSTTAPPAGIPRPLIVTLLGWATVAQGGLTGLYCAAIFLVPFPSAVWSSLAHWDMMLIVSLFPLLSGIRPFLLARKFLALNPDVYLSVRNTGVMPPAFLIGVTAVLSAIRLIRDVFIPIVRDTGGWASPELSA